MRSPRPIGASERFDVVITDLGMPHVDGRKVAAAIKGISGDHARHTAHRLGPAHDRREGDARPCRPGVEQTAAPAELRAALAELCRDFEAKARLLIVDDEVAQMRALCDTLRWRATHAGIHLGARGAGGAGARTSSICC